MFSTLGLGGKLGGLSMAFSRPLRGGKGGGGLRHRMFWTSPLMGRGVPFARPFVISSSNRLSAESFRDTDLGLEPPEHLRTLPLSNTESLDELALVWWKLLELRTHSWASELASMFVGANCTRLGGGLFPTFLFFTVG